MIQIIIIMVVFSTIVWICIQIWNCINIRNLGKLYEKLNVMHFLYGDRTELYFQFMSSFMTWSIYLGSVYNNPEGIQVIRWFVYGNGTLCEGCVFDYLTIQWDKVNLTQNDLDLWLPSSIPVPLTSKFFLGNLLRKPSTLFSIITYTPQNGKVKPVTSLYKILANDDTEEVVSTDTTSV